MQKIKTGTKVLAEFGGEIYEGTIVAYDNADGSYLVHSDYFIGVGGHSASANPRFAQDNTKNLWMSESSLTPISEDTEHITYDEYINKVVKLGYNITRDEHHGFIEVKSGRFSAVRLVEISTKYVRNLDTYFEKEVDSELFDLSVRLADTPLDKRVDERVDSRKYYLRLPVTTIFGGSDYLNKGVETNKYITSTKEQSGVYQTQFTREEIDKLKKDTQIGSFVKTLIEEEV